MATRIEYDTAIDFAEICLRVPDPELLHGKVEKNQAGYPWGNQGNFAVVYKFRARSGHPRALRCFTAPIKPDTRERYELMGAHFRQEAKAITADFRYYDQGIEVAESQQGQTVKKVYPLIDMEWVEGVTLFKQVEKLCQQQDRAGLGELADKWLELVQELHRAKMAHGDLSAVNVMVRPDGRLVLIDYDGVYIPALRGRQQVLLGTVEFQHPRVSQRAFDEWMDEFSALVIYTALLALQAQPALWGMYVRYDGARALDPTLLFTRPDFVAPQQSALFRDLERSPAEKVREVAQELKKACQLQVAQVRFPIRLFDPERAQKQALALFQQALDVGDDERAAQLWRGKLEQYAPAQGLRPKLELVELRLKALSRFRQALQSGARQQILADYDAALLNICQNVSSAEREQLALAQQLDDAFTTDKDEHLVAAWKNIEHSKYAGFLVLSAPEQQRLSVAQRHKTLIETFRAALATRLIGQIVAAFDPELETFPGLTSEERLIVVRALSFHSACQRNDDEMIEDIASEIRDIHVFNRALTFSPEEQARIQLAQERKKVILRFQQALRNKNARQIVDAYDHAVLDTCQSIAGEERRKLELAEEWETAWKLDRDERIIAAWEAIAASPDPGFLVFSKAEEARVDLARQRKAALDVWRLALSSKEVQQIVGAYQPMLHQRPEMTQEERDILARAQAFYQAYLDDDDLAIEDAAQQIQNIHLYSKALRFTEAETLRIQLAVQRKEALAKFRLALKNQLAMKIEEDYDPYLLGGCKNVTQDERDQLENARRFNRMRQAVLVAIQDNDLKGADAAYNEALAGQFNDFTPEERQRIEVIHLWGQLERALDADAYLLTIRTAQAIEQATGKLVSDERLRQVKRKFISTMHPKNVRVNRLGGHVQVQWEWPASDLVPAVAVAWRFDRFPGIPQDVPSETKPGNPYHCYRSRGAEQQGAYMINAGLAQRVYIQVFSALPDWDQRLKQHYWYYSNGQEDSSKAIA